MFVLKHSCGNLGVHEKTTAKGSWTIGYKDPIWYMTQFDELAIQAIPCRYGYRIAICW